MLEFKNYKDLMSKLQDKKVCRDDGKARVGMVRPFSRIIMELNHTN
jgi:hypothetical protein